jgi:hypothetical protein
MIVLCVRDVNTMDFKTKFALLIVAGVTVLISIIVGLLAAKNSADHYVFRAETHKVIKENQKRIQTLGNNLVLPETGVKAGTYTSASLVLNDYGLVTSASDGEMLTDLTGQEGLEVETTAPGARVVSLPVRSGVTPGEYRYPTLTVDASGMVTAVSSSPEVVSRIRLGPEFGGQVITTKGELKMQTVPGLTAGVYENATITVTETGLITSAKNGRFISKGVERGSVIVSGAANVSYPRVFADLPHVLARSSYVGTRRLQRIVQPGTHGFSIPQVVVPYVARGRAPLGGIIDSVVLIDSGTLCLLTRDTSTIPNALWFFAESSPGSRQFNDEDSEQLAPQVTVATFLRPANQLTGLSVGFAYGDTSFTTRRSALGVWNTPKAITAVHTDGKNIIGVCSFETGSEDSYGFCVSSQDSTSSSGMLISSGPEADTWELLAGSNAVACMSSMAHTGFQEAAPLAVVAGLAYTQGDNSLRPYIGLHVWDVHKNSGGPVGTVALAGPFAMIKSPIPNAEPATRVAVTSDGSVSGYYLVYCDPDTGGAMLLAAPANPFVPVSETTLPKWTSTLIDVTGTCTAPQIAFVNGLLVMCYMRDGELRFAEANEHPPTTPWKLSSLGTGAGNAGLYSTIQSTEAADGTESMEVLWNNDAGGLSSFSTEMVTRWSAVGE